MASALSSADTDRYPSIRRVAEICRCQGAWKYSTAILNYWPNVPITS